MTTTAPSLFPTQPTAMKATDVLDALTKRWPDSKYLNIDEAPQSCDRGGRKIDRLVVSLWRSRGLELDAVEVKVSYSDWRRELAEIEKADFWFVHTHRFWVAVPAELAPKVLPELPAPWGLLACTEAGTKVAKKPERHDAEPMPWSTCVGVMRASADAGSNALNRAEHAGYRRGEEAGRKNAESGRSREWRLVELERLKKSVADFEAASGVEIGTYNGGQIGAVVAAVMAEVRDPGRTFRIVENNADFVIRQAESLIESARTVKLKAAAIGAVCAASVDTQDTPNPH